MLLILSNSQDATADYLEAVLRREGVGVLRFNTDASLADAAGMYDGVTPLLRLARQCYRPADFANVWFRRPERLKRGDFDGTPEARFLEDEWSEFLEGFLAHIDVQKWMNHPARNVAASHKIDQLTRARSIGLLAPDTLVTQDAEQLRSFFAKHGGRIIAKPLATGYVQREGDRADTLIYTNRVTSAHLDNLDDLRTCPTLFQQEIDKRSDVRITVVDGDIHTVEIVAPERDGSQRCDVRRNYMRDVTYRTMSLPAEIETQVSNLTTLYGLRFAAIDMAISTGNDWYFFEVNPNGQWAWLDLVGATNIAKSFIKAFSNGKQAGLAAKEDERLDHRRL